MLQITIDTNVLISGLEGTTQSEMAAFETLRDIERQGHIRLSLTSRFDRDKEDDMDIDRVKRHYRVARSFPNIGGPFRLGVSILGGPDCLVGDNYPNFEVVFGITDPSSANPHTLADIDHLYAHWLAGHDYFLTFDKPILKKAVALIVFGVKVMSPDVFVEIVNSVIDKKADFHDFDDQLRSALDATFMQQL